MYAPIYQNRLRVRCFLSQTTDIFSDYHFVIGGGMSCMYKNKKKQKKWKQIILFSYTLVPLGENLIC